MPTILYLLLISCTGFKNSTSLKENATRFFLLTDTTDETLSLSISGSLSQDGTTVSNTLITTSSTSLSTSTSQKARQSSGRLTYTDDAVRCVDMNLNSKNITCLLIVDTSKITEATTGCFSVYYSSSTNAKLDSIARFQSITSGNQIKLFHQDKVPTGATAFSVFSCNGSEAYLTSTALSDYSNSDGVFTDKNGNYTVSLQAGKYHTLKIRRATKDLGDITVDLSSVTTEDGLNEIKNDKSKLSISVPSGFTNTITINGPVKTTGTTTTTSSASGTDSPSIDITTLSQEADKDVNLAAGVTLSYTGSSYIFTQNTAITTQTPTISGGTISSCSVSPTLPSGLSLSSTTCVISGTPLVSQIATTYSISATTSTGSTATASIQITVNASGGGITTYTIGGTISGLGGELVELQNNAGDNLSSTSDGTFTFATALTSGTAYSVTVLTQPSSRTCVVSNGSGTVSANVTNVSVTCSTSCTLLGGSMQGCAASLSNIVTTVAGTAGITGTINDTGTAARFNSIYSVITDGTDFYISDTENCRIRKLEKATGIVTTLAGSSSGYNDATGTAAQFGRAYGITTDGTNVYLGDYDNRVVRQIVISTGEVTTLAGPNNTGTAGYQDGTGAAARFDNPAGITTDGTNLYVSDNKRIRQIVISTGVVSTIAGSGTAAHTDGTGTGASFYDPFGITSDGTNLFISERGGYTIRKLVLGTNVVTTIAGTHTTQGSTDATGASANFMYPVGIVYDGVNLIIGDQHAVRKIE